MPIDGVETEVSVVTRALIAGRSKIERGWCQGIGSFDGKVCAAVAIGFAGYEAIRILKAVIGCANIDRAIALSRLPVLLRYHVRPGYN